MPTQQCDLLITHMATATFNRRETFEGREHLVAPVIPLVAGVVNAELCPPEEIGRYVDAWNGIPLPIGHPMERGLPVSANRPDLVDSRSVGRFFNAQFDGERLRGELWVDVEKAKQSEEGQEVLRRLEEGNPLEVSTAYFRDSEDQTGMHEGREYQGIQRNLRPDHLSLLPYGEGACSWMDGAGAPRVNENGGGEPVGMWSTLKKMMTTLPWFNQEDVSHDEIAEALENAMADEKGDVMRFLIRERYDEYFVYQEASPDGSFAGRMFKRRYTIDDDHNVALGDQEEVRRIVSYEPVADEDGEPDDISEGSVHVVDNTEKVEGMITNDATSWCEEDRPLLEGLAEEQLDQLSKIEAKFTTNEEEEEEEEEVVEEEGEEEKTMTFDEWVETIPDEEIRDEMRANRKRITQRREKMVKDLASNDRCAFDKEDLQAMKTNQLEKLSESLKPEDYSGVGGPQTHSTDDDDDEIPAPPPVILAKREEGGNR